MESFEGDSPVSADCKGGSGQLQFQQEMARRAGANMRKSVDTLTDVARALLRRDEDAERGMGSRRPGEMELLEEERPGSTGGGGGGLQGGHPLQEGVVGNGPRQLERAARSPDLSMRKSIASLLRSGRTALIDEEASDSTVGEGGGPEGGPDPDRNRGATAGWAASEGLRAQKETLARIRDLQEAGGIVTVLALIAAAAVIGVNVWAHVPRGKTETTTTEWLEAKRSLTAAQAHPCPEDYCDWFATAAESAGLRANVSILADSLWTTTGAPLRACTCWADLGGKSTDRELTRMLLTIGRAGEWRLPKMDRTKRDTVREAWVQPTALGGRPCRAAPGPESDRLPSLTHKTEDSFTRIGPRSVWVHQPTGEWMPDRSADPRYYGKEPDGAVSLPRICVAGRKVPTGPEVVTEVTAIACNRGPPATHDKNPNVCMYFIAGGVRLCTNYVWRLEEARLNSEEPQHIRVPNDQLPMAGCVRYAEAATEEDEINAEYAKWWQTWQNWNHLVISNCDGRSLAHYGRDSCFFTSYGNRWDFHNTPMKMGSMGP